MRQRLERLGSGVAFALATTAPAGPADVIGRSMARVRCSYNDEVPVISAPGCFRSGRPNVVDLILPPMLARYHVSGWEIACLGHGGLLA
jgi:hypothetical protein